LSKNGWLGFFNFKEWRGEMEERNYRQEGYRQGLEDATKVLNKNDLEKKIRNVYTKYPHINALEYMTGYIGGFSKSNMASINVLWGKGAPSTS
jgi:hypothetical protein